MTRQKKAALTLPAAQLPGGGRDADALTGSRESAEVVAEEVVFGEGVTRLEAGRDEGLHDRCPWSGRTT